MVDVEKFMADYIAIKQTIDVEKQKAQNAVAILIANGCELDETQVASIVDVLIAKNVGEAKKTLDFYEKYLVEDKESDDIDVNGEV